MVHSISASGFYHLDVIGCLRKADQLGYGAVEAGYTDLFSLRRGPDQRYLREEDFRSRKVVEKIIEARERWGTALSGVHGPVVPLNDPRMDEREWMTREAFARMQIIGARSFTVHAGSATVESLEAELPVIERNIAQLVKLAADYDVVVCVESGCCPYELRTPQDIAALLDRVPGARHTSDLSHFVSQLPPYDAVGETLRLMGDRTEVVHVVDWDPAKPWCHDLPAGMGIIDWPRFLGGLLDAGFDGVLVCENTPDALSRFLLHLHALVGGADFVLPPSTVFDPAVMERDARKVLGHDAYMRRLPTPGVAIAWGGADEKWDGSALSDRLYSASLRYVKEVLAGLAAK